MKNEELQEKEHNTQSLSFGQRLLRSFDKFGDLFVLNICFSVSCIPIVTIGAAMTALYTVTNRMTDNREGSISKDYFKAFRSNLAQGTTIFIFDALFALLILACTTRLNSLGPGSNTRMILTALSGILFFIFSISVPMQFPLLARYEKNTPGIIFNALILSLSHPGTWLKLYFIWMLPVTLYYFNLRLLMYTWYLWCMILTALFAYICSIFLVKFYEKIEAEEKSEK